jgi:diguanylate cyclase (GGDEF)-like protein
MKGVAVQIRSPIAADGFRGVRSALLDAVGAISEAQDCEQLNENFFEFAWHLVRPEMLALAVRDRHGGIQSALLRSKACAQAQYVDKEYPEPLARLASRLRERGGDARIRHRGMCWLAINSVSSARRSEFLMLATRRPLTCERAQLDGLTRIYRNLHRLLDECQRDKLTGLRNRRTLLDSLAKCLKAGQPAAPEGRVAAAEYWLAVIDIDHFKRVNDRFGHVFGDEVLVLLARLMNECFRDNDLLFRVGGEEFVVVLGVPGREGAAASLERFRGAVKAQHFPQVGVVTVSIGAACLADPAASTEIFDRADQALYRSKKNGRDRVTFFEDLRGSAQHEHRTGSIELFEEAPCGLGAEAIAVSPPASVAGVTTFDRVGQR